MTDDDVDIALRAGADSWDVRRLSERIVEVLSARPEWSLADIERRLRQLGLDRARLVAASVQQMPRSTRDGSGFHFDTERPPHGHRIASRKIPSGEPASHWCYMCLNGEAEALHEMKQHGISNEDENLLLLENTGFMCLEEDDKRRIN